MDLGRFLSILVVTSTSIVLCAIRVHCFFQSTPFTQSLVYTPPITTVSPVLSPSQYSSSSTKSTTTTRTILFGRSPPRRLDDNVPGVLYVNDRCIHCAACSGFAPTVFARSSSDTAHVVCKQPDDSDLDDARAALSACPVGAIRVENPAQRRHRGDQEYTVFSEDDQSLAKSLAIQPRWNSLDLPFPRPLVVSDNRNNNPKQTQRSSVSVYYLGYHNEKTFGAVPYLALGSDAEGRPISVMVDVPKPVKPAFEEVSELCVQHTEGQRDRPDYLVLTHVDDTAGHGAWVERFPGLKRVFHAGDLGRHNWLGDRTLEDVEVLLGTLKSHGQDTDREDTEMEAWALDGTPVTMNSLGSSNGGGDFQILHTPGHSPGSVSLLFAPAGVLFTGDTYGYTTRNGGTMTGFPKYGYDTQLQARSLERLIQTTGDLWNIVAPGHGHRKDYFKPNQTLDAQRKAKQDDLTAVMAELLSWS